MASGLINYVSFSCANQSVNNSRLLSVGKKPLTHFAAPIKNNFKNLHYNNEKKKKKILTFQRPETLQRDSTPQDSKSIENILAVENVRNTVPLFARGNRFGGWEKKKRKRLRYRLIHGSLPSEGWGPVNFVSTSTYAWSCVDPAEMPSRM